MTDLGSTPEYTQLSPAIAAKYMALSTGGKVQAEYIWLGGNQELRCKTKTLSKKPRSLADLPMWNYDGSSTNQAPGDDSEVYIYPVAMYPDPFRGGDHILVLCDTYAAGTGEPLPTNTRCNANKLFSQKKETEPWFGIEQEYTLFAADGITPFGWPKGGMPGPQGPYYCGAGASSAFGREIADCHYRCCLYSGLDISGINAEVMPGQWEYQIGPCVGIASGDQLTISRYLMLRVCEDFGVIVSFHPKPMKGDWNGAGCHTNVSTKETRAEGGYEVIKVMMEKLAKKHQEHIECYGVDNEQRLTGKHETAGIDKFSYGVANRGASVRIPRTTEADGKGYFEDRRPASNMDPYVVTSKIYETCVLLD